MGSVVQLFASNDSTSKIPERFEVKIEKGLHPSTLVDIAWFELVGLVVPQRFRSIFLLETKDYPYSHKLLLLGIAWRESEWIHMRSHHSNKDGTYDWGPMGLNESNIKNAWFRQQFYAYDYDNGLYDKDIVYMVTCLRFVEDLSIRFNHDYELVLIAYNSGPRNAINMTPPPSTQRYVQYVLTYASLYEEMFQSFLNDSINIWKCVNDNKHIILRSPYTNSYYSSLLYKFHVISNELSTDYCDTRKKIYVTRIQWFRTTPWFMAAFDTMSYQMDTDNKESEKKSGYCIIYLYSSQA